MVQDAINSIRVTLSDRIGNPMVSGFIIGIVLVNWKLSLLVFSDISYHEKVDVIMGLYPSSSVRLHSFLIYPALAGSFWTFIWPLISLFINAYWHWMKSKAANIILWAERKRTISESEASEIYSIIDSQEAKYLELIKDRQSRIDDLLQQISSLNRELISIRSAVSDKNEQISLLQSSEDEARKKLSRSEEFGEKADRDRASLESRLKEIESHAFSISSKLPGLKAIVKVIEEAKNHQAHEQWAKKEIKKQENALSEEDIIATLNLYICLGLIKRDNEGYLTFGDRLLYGRGGILGLYPNSPKEGSRNIDLS